MEKDLYCFAGCLGITLSYHRQISHRSFQTPKWLEYFFAYCGVLAVQVIAHSSLSDLLLESQNILEA